MSSLFLTNKQLILASASPRRKDYLQGLGITFVSMAAQIDEQPMAGEKPEPFVERMAAEKAAEISGRHVESWVVAADTVVSLGDRIFGKPSSGEEAVEMLLALAGRRHEVRTGYCLHCVAEKVKEVGSVVSQVEFASFDEQLARAYVETGEPMDKAGAYGIQGKGACLVKSVNGSYSNVVGLPLDRVLSLLLRYDVVRVVGAVSL